MGLASRHSSTPTCSYTLLAVAYDSDASISTFSNKPYRQQFVEPAEIRSAVHRARSDGPEILSVDTFLFCNNLLYTAWRAGLRRNWNLPYNCHTDVLRMLSDVLPLQDLICKRSISFANKCLISESDLVRYVAQYSILYGRMHSTLGHNVQYCCERYSVVSHTTLCSYSVINQSINQSINKFIAGNEAHKHTDTQTNRKTDTHIQKQRNKKSGS